jgi:hypothetical protein
MASLSLCDLDETLVPSVGSQASKKWLNKGKGLTT